MMMDRSETLALLRRLASCISEATDDAAAERLLERIAGEGPELRAVLLELGALAVVRSLASEVGVGAGTDASVEDQEPSRYSARGRRDPAAVAGSGGSDVGDGAEPESAREGAGRLGRPGRLREGETGIYALGMGRTIRGVDE
jgi:hypothetical protein